MTGNNLAKGECRLDTARRERDTAEAGNEGLSEVMDEA
jgi:hypothetical protein